MIIGIGTDIAEVDRIERALETYGEQFERKVFTPEEIAYCRSSPRRAAERFAARFAAKEAFAKALGTGIARGVYWRDIGVSRRPGERPQIVLRGHAATLSAGMLIHLSITHSGNTALATVILERP